ncbi:hypothetical protein CRUP_008358 [Coryphaenoides rupestris]|nr:hypothetical protein CRUP_008358 [Coryphaenoides rupestris]
MIWERSAQWVFLGYELWVVLEVKEFHLLEGGLAGGETPGLRQHLRTSLRKGESTPRYLDTTYRQNRCLSMPSPVMANRDLTKAQLSLEQERTVSVRPSRNSRVMDASLSWMKASGLMRSFLMRPFPKSWNGKMWQSTSSANTCATARELDT